VGPFGEADAREAFRRAGGRPARSTFTSRSAGGFCYYCGCNMLVTRNETLVERYLRTMELELDRVAALLSSRPEVVQVHLGGGTPTHLNPNQLSRLVEAIQDCACRGCPGSRHR
jgi:oxygen-independent coproporphyrinogen-3 oxidase